MRLRAAFAALILVLSTALPASAADHRARAKAANSALAQFYDQNTGLYRTTNWWNAANALNAELDSDRLLGTSTGRAHAVTTHAKHSPGGFLNDYYDDQGWWALTWINAYELTRDGRYLNSARSLFQDITGAWDNTCGGGVWWNRERRYKNAITNELFITIAAKLARVTSEAHYRDWALRGWNWFRSTGMLNRGDLVNDGLDSACRNNSGAMWTYNQGVILQALVELTAVTGDRGHLDVAHRIAGAATRMLSVDQRVLLEPCEPSCGADGPQFKGIFARGLRDLHRADGRNSYRAFLASSAQSLWTTSRNSANQIGLSWTGPFDTADAARQSSAQDALNAAVAVSAPVAAPSPRAAAACADRGSASSYGRTATLWLCDNGFHGHLQGAQAGDQIYVSTDNLRYAVTTVSADATEANTPAGFWGRFRTCLRIGDRPQLTPACTPHSTS
ncbi:glycoside hydrolase family 76 protein [Allokutzneria oryzae]|uniref:Glycoside hydrolase family 76 protein n=1 Tax=Allokutzneria oryzae TaxID=1378989 RepID=A0ABV5ZPG7_9PSEU